MADQKQAVTKPAAQTSGKTQIPAGFADRDKQER
jgi:hypothetical protein